MCVCMYVCMLSTLSNIFSSETTGPIEWDGGTKVCSNGPGQMTKLTTMPIYGTKRPMTLKLGMQHRVLEYYQVCSNDDPGLEDIYVERTNFVLWLVLNLESSFVKYASQ